MIDIDPTAVDTRDWQTGETTAVESFTLTNNKFMLEGKEIMANWTDVKLQDLTVFFLKTAVALMPAALLVFTAYTTLLMTTVTLMGLIR
jgi:hypothetical protein